MSRSTATAISDMVELRRLATTAEAERFGELLSELESQQMSDEEVRLALEVYDDETARPEVMFGLVHALERRGGERLVAAICDHLPTMIARGAGEWAETHLARLANTSAGRDALAAQLSTASSRNDAVLEVLERLASRGRPARLLASLRELFAQIQRR